MIKTYKFDYSFGEAGATFKVDTDKFTVEMAKATLEFFTWFYDKDADPIDEVLKKYAIQAIRFATTNSCSIIGVIEEFNICEGFARVDGSIGIELIDVDRYEIEEYQIIMYVEEETVPSG